ncbi:DUF4113 domain-containing protein [Methylotenera sp.]
MKLASEGIKSSWKIRLENKCPSYTTR